MKFFHVAIAAILFSLGTSASEIEVVNTLERSYETDSASIERRRDRCHRIDRKRHCQRRRGCEWVGGRRHGYCTSRDRDDHGGWDRERCYQLRKWECRRADHCRWDRRDDRCRRRW